MPELPEVQTTVGDLKKRIIGRRIVGVWFDAPKIIKAPKAAEFKALIKGLRVKNVARRGKNILIYLVKGSKNKLSKRFLLLIHQKMTGHLLVGKWSVSGGKVRSLMKGALAERVNDYIHLIFYLDDGRALALSDLRKFAKAVFGEEEKVAFLPELKKLGPEPLSPTFRLPDFKKLVSREKRGIKKVLLDQEVVSGIGNIYSDEILWQAKINPLKPADKLTAKELRNLYLATKLILKKAVRLRGTSTGDFRDTAGRPGRYTEARLVYQRGGVPCNRCRTPIKRIKVGGRSAHYCPKCQR